LLISLTILGAAAPDVTPKEIVTMFESPFL
jgi:hypothetical protein